VAAKGFFPAHLSTSADVDDGGPLGRGESERFLVGGEQWSAVLVCDSVEVNFRVRRNFRDEQANLGAMRGAQVTQRSGPAKGPGGHEFLQLGVVLDVYPTIDNCDYGPGAPTVSQVRQPNGSPEGAPLFGRPRPRRQAPVEQRLQGSLDQCGFAVLVGGRALAPE
jgi:hypothetical protein